MNRLRNHLVRARRSGRRLWLPVAAMFLGFCLNPSAVRACAACAGQSDSPMAQGMNWGIFSLLGIIVLVLAGVAGFFIYLARRNGAGAVPPPAGELAAATNKI